ncbi:serine/threonine protein kinase [Streptomyces lincolnensis]|uniref:Serine/threonine protein kinase n=1 Tax=Streptomyces lincolnensis TaxID=1915 RepID=A0A1B1MK78_STRLN|nr:serine/threonine-protein kinase [Streptomyces lincolnensis]ANS68984.1 serine/threonine protein kinase [Streptomyces lincolnensis]AXG57903.1 serine/threonine protein kinase [Streptomyces lincolnensis]QMV10573.1 protein kinase [Streptomyces lincolnensis]
MPADDVTAALRRTGASPLRLGDPRRVGPYAPVALLGSGGMGRVYLARTADDGPGLVAVKVIRPEYAEDPRFRRRFEREASVHARLRTRHTPRLCGTGFEDELLWMATEYLPGYDLAEAVREDGTLGTAAVWRLVAELGQALVSLGAEEIVHRDLKPSNVLLSVRGAHVIDFGISKAVDASAITGTGNRVGTPAYMSPEHLREGRSDTASDVFSLAGTLVYAATGRAPFGDGTGVDVMHRVAFEEPNPEVVREVSAADAELGALLTACLAKEPEQRPTPRELVDAAGARSVPATWPEPLGGKVLARQQAYEALHRLPVADMARLRSPGDLPPALSALSASPARVSPPAAPVPEPPAKAGPATAPARSRRKPLLIAVAGVSVCAVAVVALLLLRQDPPAAASPETGVTGTVDTAPGAGAATGVSPGTGGQSRPELDGALDENVEDRTGTTVPRPGASGSAGDEGEGDEGLDDGTTAGTTPDASPTPTPSAADPSAGTGTAPWLSDCTHYSGNGRTRLGDSGKRVQQVQCMLTKRGYGVGSSGVDGEFGSGTETAVRAFQSDRGLAADGVVARDTWGALRSAE